ncbi:hypothetical protein Tco_0164909, partial [Tanacetum coccineum]
FILDSDIEGKNEESYKFPIVVQQSFNSLWSQDVHGDPNSGIGGHWRSLAVIGGLQIQNGIACIYLEGISLYTAIRDINIILAFKEFICLCCQEISAAFVVNTVRIQEC